ncbi:MAG: alpha/beta hydrolase [Cellvibrionaceae bacterium]|nr:alpha/beta hydrolase [Cellvibrionaceae bacterium]
MAKFAFLFSAAMQLSYCVSAVARLDKTARQSGLTPLIFSNNLIPLKGYINHLSSPLGTVYIYLEGDGKPWERYRPAQNPNTRQPTSLPLMLSTKRDALYLFRPCYGWQVMPDRCEPSMWTSARYSQKVVDLLDGAINQHKAQYETKRYIIVGHSGGATLALLLASTRPDVSAVISVAGNLDHRAWTHYFNYLPLSASLALPPRHTFPYQQQHWYLVGEADTVVPAAIQLKAIESHEHNFIKRYSDYGHQCCWQIIWPAVIDEVEQQLLKAD